ncbi:putative zinc-binding protein [Clostridium sporogenes]|uniref:putative zinc-binding protein n=1 Tax=Clostridium sporogenes TaxID=1509 RepID=UPI00223715A4|nr:putative zinc-binding protein [Clostridium sporogenes]MCW6074669.1 putative zinc-binding protein [Clostridium sporogenes]
MSKVKIIPCSGIGKVFGLMARESALKVTNELKPNETETVCLAHVVTGDTDATKKIEGYFCITIDGCPKFCSAKAVELSGGIVKTKYRTVDEMKKHRGVNAGTATALTEDGWEIVDELCAKVCEKIDEILKEDQ